MSSFRFFFFQAKRSRHIFVAFGQSCASTLPGDWGAGFRWRPFSADRAGGETSPTSGTGYSFDGPHEVLAVKRISRSIACKIGSNSNNIVPIRLVLHKNKACFL